MKKLLAILMALVLLLSLTACQSSSGPVGDDDDDEEERQEEEGELFTAGEVSYRIEEVDNSIYNENGDILVRRSYQKVILVGADPSYEVINGHIDADCAEFLQSGENWTEEELEESLEFNGLDYDSYYNMAYVSTVETADGVLHIQMSVDWYMGGVTDGGSYDLFFDLETGEPLPVEGQGSAGEEDAVQSQGVPYEIVLVDNSVVNENGDILVRRTYEKVVLLSDDPACVAINALIEADCEAFLADNEYMSVEDYEEIIEMGGYGYDAFFETATATVIHNANGIISIKIGADYFQGGVYNINYYGMTFDLTTGREAELVDILGMPEDEATELIREVAAEGLTEYYGDALFGDPAELLQTYSLEDFLFYVDNGELVLAFSTYEFSYGAAGPANIYTGIFIGE